MSVPIALCSLLLFATAPEKGSFRAFLTVRKIFFSAFRAQYRSRTKKRRKCLLLCLLLFFLFFLRCGFRPEIRRKTTISCGFSLELIAGFEPATSSLPRKRSTSPNGITLLCSMLEKPLYIVLFILLYHYF